MKNSFTSIILLTFIGLKVIAQIPTNGLVAYYPFRGNANDASGNNNHGTVTGAALTENRFGDADSAYKFNGINQYIEVPDNNMPSIATTGMLSISVWMRCDTLDFPNPEGEYVHWMGKGVSSQHEWTFRIYNLNSSRPNRTSCYAFNLTGGLGAGSYAEETLTKGQWMHFVAVYNYPQNTIMIYKNGILRDTDFFTDYSITPGNGTAPFRIGTRDFNSFFKGAVDDIRMYNRILDSTEIQNLYHENGWDVAVGVNPYNDPNTVKIYPNPTAGQFTVSCFKSLVHVINIYDVFGKLVLQKTVNNKQETINLDVPGGIYFYQLERERQIIDKGKIIIQ